MRKVLDILEFEEMCDEMGPVTFIYDERRQPDETPVSYANAVSTYTGVYVILMPCNSIIFRNHYGSLSFSGVKQIMYDDIPADSPDYLDKLICGDLGGGEEYTSSEVFTIVCGDRGTDVNDTPYNIFVDRDARDEGKCPKEERDKSVKHN